MKCLQRRQKLHYNLNYCQHMNNDCPEHSLKVLVEYVTRNVYIIIAQKPREEIQFETCERQDNFRNDDSGFYSMTSLSISKWLPTYKSGIAQILMNEISPKPPSLRYHSPGDLKLYRHRCGYVQWHSILEVFYKSNFEDLDCLQYQRLCCSSGMECI